MTKKLLAGALGLMLLGMPMAANAVLAADVQVAPIPKNMPKDLFNDAPLAPTKVFDDLYCIGSRSVVAWALQTSDGIILIDAMWDNHDAQNMDYGMRMLGLDPKDVKVVLITQGHGDHYGGAQYFKDTYGAKIYMSQPDYQEMMEGTAGANGPRSPKAQIDGYLTGGQEFKLGDTVVTIASTPGHSPGSLSFFYPVHQDGQEFIVAQWGGKGLPQTLKDKKEYRQSIETFADYAKKMHADVAVFGHLFDDDGFAKLNAAPEHTKGQANPFYLGEEGMKDYIQYLRDFADKGIKAQEEAGN